MFGLIKKIFIGLLTGLLNASNHSKCVSLNIQKCMTQHTLISLHPNEYSQDLHYYLFAVKLDRCVGGFNTFNDLSKQNIRFKSKRVQRDHRSKRIENINKAYIMRM